MPIQTAWGLLVRKSTIQSVVLKPRVLSFSIGFLGEIVKGGGYGVLCESVGSESILVVVQAGRDVILDMMENQFLKGPHQDVGESHRVVVV